MVYTRGSSTLESYTDVCGPAVLGCIQRISFPSLETQLASLVSKLDVARAERIKRTTSIFWQCLRKQKQIKCESMLSGCSVKFVWSDIKCLMPAWINQHAVGYLFLLELHYFLLCLLQSPTRRHLKVKVVPEAALCYAKLLGRLQTYDGFGGGEALRGSRSTL